MSNSGSTVSGSKTYPGFGVDEGNEAFEFGRVLNLVLGFTEDDS